MALYFLAQSAETPVGKGLLSSQARSAKLANSQLGERGTCSLLGGLVIHNGKQDLAQPHKLGSRAVNPSRRWHSCSGVGCQRWTLQHGHHCSSMPTWGAQEGTWGCPPGVRGGSRHNSIQPQHPQALEAATASIASAAFLTRSYWQGRDVHRGTRQDGFCHAAGCPVHGHGQPGSGTHPPSLLHASSLPDAEMGMSRSPE